MSFSPTSPNDSHPMQSDDNYQSNFESSFNRPSPSQRLDASVESELEAALEHMKSNDAIMDLNIIQSMNIAFQQNVSPIEMINSLCDSYKGYAKMVQILADSLVKVHQIGHSNTSTTNISTAGTVASMSKLTNIVPSQLTALSTNESSLSFDINQTICESLVDIVKEQFNKLVFDELITKFSDIPVWLIGLIEDPIFRKMLIELYDANRNSTLLGLCLREISTRGYCREISKIISEVEYFEVFNHMIVDILMAVSNQFCGSLCVYA